MTNAEFPRLYAAQFASRQDDIAWWLQLAGSASGAVLELGSGTGRVAVRLAQAGYTVVGIERDLHMLQWAIDHTPSACLTRLRYIQADIARLDLPDRFQLVISPCNTLAMLPRPEFEGALRCAHDMLEPGGLLAFELPAPGDFIAPGQSAPQLLSMFIEPVSGNPVQLYAQHHFDSAEKVTTLTWIYDELSPDGQVHRHTFVHRMWLWDRQAVTDALKDVGFEAVAVFGGYHGEKADEHAACMLVVATRP